MNDIQYHQSVQNAVKGRFRGKDAIASKSIPKFPDGAEREFRRITNQYMKIVNQTLKAHLPTMMQAYKRERHGDSRFDDTNDLDREISQELFHVTEELEQKLEAFGLTSALEKIGRITQRTSLREWKRIVKDTLGIDLLDDYYKGEFYAEALKRWVDENVLRIKTIPGESLGAIKQTILDGYKEGRTIRNIAKDIQHEYNVSKHKAAMLARDQIATLNAQITKLQQQDAGCNRYRWSTSNDSRVRDCHRSLNGKTFSWDDPPEMWYETKSRGRVYTGRHCHPGEDICCRCVAIPVFDFSTVNIPMQGKQEDV